jgi:hypothetical protein
MRFGQILNSSRRACLAAVVVIAGFAVLSAPAMSGQEAASEPQTSDAQLQDAVISNIPHRAAMSVFTQFKDEKCHGWPHVLLKLGSDSAKLSAGKRIFIRAVAGSRPRMCTNIGSFIPESGRHYIAIQEWPDVYSECRFYILDAETRKPPGTYVAHLTAKECSPF